ncbi:ROK family protein [Nocardioides sp. DS6]|uniref:ROK family protein n=1 Tax=Nocardioides eburneus TaxID=3231482 RepID=A0ABV3T0I3_9ACTN
MSTPSGPGRAALQHAGMRASNLALVLGQVADAGPLSRAQVAARTGLTKSSVSGLVADLVEAGLVTESAARGSGPAPGSASGGAGSTPTRDRGRPASSLHLDRQGAAGLGLEVNVDYLAAVVCDLGGAPRYRHVVTRDNRGPGAGEVARVLDELAALARAAEAAAAEQDLALAGIGIAVPGGVTDDRLVTAPNLHWTDLDLTPGLGALPVTPLGVRLENEADLAALGELWFGGQAPADFVQVSGEIGIGGGIVVGGRLFRGAHGRAGELGHVVLDPDGPACSCGGRGCLERLAGQDAIIAQAGVTDRDELLGRCRDGDETSVVAVRSAGRRLGVALATVTNLLDPDAVVLGGLFAELAPWLRPGVEESLGRHLAAPLRVLTSRLGADAAVRGAAGSVVRRIIADPAGYLALSAAGGAA